MVAERQCNHVRKSSLAYGFSIPTASPADLPSCFRRGDWPQERSFLQIFIALMSGPRLGLVGLSALLVSLSSPHSQRARWLGVTGTLRTLACGGWVYCTSTNFPMVHDVSMITYLLLTPAWMFISWGSLAPQPTKEALVNQKRTQSLSEKARKSRRNTAYAFFASIPFMCVFYYRHKVLLIPGAYTIYSFFEWNLIVQVSPSHGSTTACALLLKSRTFFP